MNSDNVPDIVFQIVRYICIAIVAAGCVYGTAKGFYAHGIGGALLFAVFGAAGGGGAFVVVFGIIRGIIYVIFEYHLPLFLLLSFGGFAWLVIRFWDVGKP